MKPLSQKIKEKPWLGWLLFTATIIVVFLLGLLASSIVERRAEAVYAFSPAAEIGKWEPRNQVWGIYYPQEYRYWLQNSDTSFYSRYNGNGPIDMLERDPRMVVLWAGYGFAKDYEQAQGHYYSIRDIRRILRTGAPMEPDEGPMPNTCWTCKSPDVPRVMSEVGIAEFYEGKWAERGHQIVNQIGCADCHDAETMNLHISRPALIEAFERMGRDVTRASHQEMRSLVCAQCHVEYYFKGEGNYLTFPWDNGTSVDSMEAYYDRAEFSDWTHAISKTPLIKAQHPGYEIFKEGIHYKRGVACADCHMPYHSEGGQKFTNHHIQSPLNYINSSCQVCHRQSEEELRQNVYSNQEKVYQQRIELEDMLVMAHVEAGKAWELGATGEQMAPILTNIRHAQWRWDYAVASHGASAHAPAEVLRIISSAIGKAQAARIQLAKLHYKLGFEGEVPYPDISTKSKAQRFIGLDMDKLYAEKKEFLKEIVPRWEEIAAEREENWEIPKEDE
jgi:nitrite reductase (cytochrome c-552)